MPHKHKRSRKDDTDFDLPPTKVARPLPASKIKTDNETVFTTKKEKRPRAVRPAAKKKDDTPREFARLMRMASGEKFGPMLDNGERLSKKEKKRRNNQNRKGADENEDGDDVADGPTSAATTAATTQSSTSEAPVQQQQQPKLKIRPGEKLSDFSARVNQTISIAGLTHKAKKVEGIREHVPRHVRKLQKRTEHFRKEEDRKWMKRQEEEEEWEAKNEETIDQYGDIVTELQVASENAQGRTKKGRKKRGVEEDPWEVLKKKRMDSQKKGVHDVVSAPPQFSVVPTEKLKPKERRGLGGLGHNATKLLAQGVPAASGDWRRRAELGQERMAVINRYREMMTQK